jgi:hypothetical protein
MVAIATAAAISPAPPAAAKNRRTERRMLAIALNRTPTNHTQEYETAGLGTEDRRILQQK